MCSWMTASTALNWKRFSIGHGGFLAHETEIPAPGDYVVRKLGIAEVVVARDRQGKLPGLLE